MRCGQVREARCALQKKGLTATQGAHSTGLCSQGRANSFRRRREPGRKPQ